jgi:hypothetical protein
MRMTSAQRDIQDYRELETQLLGAAVTSVPRGRGTGLWGPLAVVVAPSLGARELPVTDTSAFGATAQMFDYDPSQAIDLDLALG